ncbi:hypothetical protein LV564_02360 [Komagataeibacter nataicola]|nr:hypothetical protein [Komagataeibacter nataicola]WEQ55970.1 hypothetical protein LV564_02360 [Komagataeibacter nataicola]
MWARAWEEVGENARVDATLSALLENDSTCISVGRLHAGLLRRRGDLPAAQAVLERLPHGAADDAPAVRDDAVANQLAVLLHGRRLLARHEMGDAAACNMHTRPCCMTVLSRRLPGAEHRLPSMGGGAERQLVNTAVGPTRAARTGAAIGQYHLSGPVEVACRALDDRPQGNFFSLT